MKIIKKFANTLLWEPGGPSLSGPFPVPLKWNDFCTITTGSNCGAIVCGAFRTFAPIFGASPKSGAANLPTIQLTI